MSHQPMNLPSIVQDAIQRLEAAGHEAYVVGGCVRDHLMGIPPHDYDLTTDATPAEMTTYIKEKLPRYMVPNVVRQLDEMPFTPNGKIDRNGLKTVYENK